jgi:hypothetical protein
MISKYADLTIKQFLNCKRISELQIDKVDKNVRLLAEISGKTIDEIESLPLTELKAKLKYITNLDTIPEGQKVKMVFKVNGKWYKCIWKTQELSAAQYIDVAHFTKDPEQIIYNIHNIMAATCVPMKYGLFQQKYDGSKHAEISEAFYNHMKIETAYPIMLFFCKYSEELAAATLTYLAKEAKEIQELLAASTQSTDGLH